MPDSSQGPHLPLSSPETTSGAVPTGAWSIFPEFPVIIYFSPFNFYLQPGASFLEGAGESDGLGSGPMAHQLPALS